MEIVSALRTSLAPALALAIALAPVSGSHAADASASDNASDNAPVPRQFDQSTLAGIYELAIQNDQLFAQSQAIYRAGWEERNLARAGILPNITAGASYTEFYSEARGAFPAGGTLFPNATDTDGDTFEWNAALVQPLFDLPAWFRFKRGVNLSKEAEANFYVAQQDLLVRSVGGYFEVLRAIANLNASKAQESALAAQLNQVQQRFDVGLVAVTDVHEAQAAFDLSVAQRLTDEGVLGVRQEQLSVLSGLPYSDLWLLKKDFPVVDPDPVDSAAWVAYARENNLEIKAAELSHAASRSDLKAARAEHLPKIDLALNYSDSDSDITQDNLISEIESDFTNDQKQAAAVVRLTVPLYSGGFTSASRRQAAAREETESAGYKGTVRRVTQETRAAYITVRSDVARTRARQQAVISNRSALDATEAGYDVGIRNVVDVLAAQQAYFSAIRDFENSNVDYVISLMDLKRLSGTLTPEDIYELNSWLEQQESISASGN